MKTGSRFWTDIHSSRRLPLYAATALLLAEGCGPAGVDEPAIDEATQSLLGSPRSAALVSRASEHLLSLRSSLGLSGDNGFVARSAVTDEFERTHTRFDQTFRGIKVWTGDVIVEMSKEVSPQSVISSLKSNIDVSTTPRLGQSEALSIAHAVLQPRGAYTRQPAVELVVFPKMAERERVNRLRGPAGELNAEDIEHYVAKYHLAYHIHTELENGATETRHTDFMIDAHSGEILKEWSTLYTAAAEGTGKSQYSGTVKLGVDSTATGFELRDITRSMNITTIDMKNGTGAGTVYADTDNTWGDGKNFTAGGSTTSDNGQTAGVDAHYGAEMTFDFFKNIMGRNGIDGSGTATSSRVHYSRSYDNAFWTDTCFCMTYGDGSMFTVLTSLDVAGHEMTHGVTSRTAKLVYSGESGGLNESFSDIFGSMVEFYARSGMGGATVPDTGGNWDIGDQLAAKPLRYMIKPSKDGKSRDEWKTGLGNIDVHYSSGPLNRAFYFLSQGSSSTAGSDNFSTYLPGGMKGIGNDKASRIAFRALAAKMTSSTNYAGARTAFLAATTDLYGATGDEYAAVENAFGAINVGKPHGGGGGSDVTAPTTKLTAPGLLATVKGTVTVSANATDDVGVTKVDFYAGAKLIGTDTTAPYSFSWDTKTVANGLNLLTAKAYDAAGNVGNAPNVLIAVKN